MRIALATSSYLPRLGGVEEHVHHVSASLRERGHDVVVWTVDQGDEPAPLDGTVRALPCPLPNRSFGGIARWLAAFPRAASAWRHAVTSDAPDVIVVQCFGANGPWAATTARRHGIPLVYANHGETFMDAHDAFGTSALLRRALGRTLRQARAVTSCSAYAAADLARFGAHRPARVVGNGIRLDLEPQPLTTGLPERYVAGVGRLVENKGFQALLTAFARLAGESAGIDLVIAGDGPERRRLEELAEDLGISERVVFTGALQRGQVRRVLDGALSLVVPSHVEAFGIVILEGWRSGAAVLATDRGGPPEFVRDEVDGLLFDPLDIDALAALLARIASDEALRGRLGESGRRAVARYSWARVAELYEGVLEDAVQDVAAKGRS